MRQPYPVTILTGFLGAGKTSFMNAFMAYKDQSRFAIIENEVGEADIDGSMVLQSDKNLMEVNNGCLCCTLNDNLFEILKELHERSDEWDELIIEATGIADPSGVAAPFFNQPVIKNNFDLRRIICLVDAGKIQDQLKAEEIAAKQIAYSDIILLNKADTVNPDSLTQLQSQMETYNPLAGVFTGQKGDWPLASMLEEANKAEQGNGTIGTMDKGHSEGAGDHSHDHHHVHGNLNALTFNFKEPFDVNLLTNALTAFLKVQAKGVYRIKGIVYDPKYSHKWVIQSVMDSVTVEPGEAWQSEEAKTSQFVIIGKGLVRKGYERMLKKGMQKSAF